MARCMVRSRVFLHLLHKQQRPLVVGYPRAHWRCLSSGQTHGNSHRDSRQRARFAPLLPGVVTLAAGGALVATTDEEKTEGPQKHTVGTRKEGLPTYKHEEVSKHTTEDTRIWVTYKEGVYDITDFVSQHPGGDLLMLAAGKDIGPFWKVYTIHDSDDTRDLLEEMRIGNFDLSSVPVTEMAVAVDDQWRNEPVNRHPALRRNQEKPFNAEPPPPILTAQYYTPNDLFYVRNHLPVPPKVDPGTYRLRVTLGNERCSQFSLEDLKGLPEYTISATIQCAGNRRSEMSRVKHVRGLEWGTAAIGNATWTGVRLRDVLLKSGYNEETLKGIRHVQFEGLDKDMSGVGYGASIPIEKALSPNGDVLLAYKMNGEELPLDHGFPLRVIVPGTVGARNVKWLSHVVLSEEESPSLWQRKDYKLFPPNIDLSNVNYSAASAMQEMPVQSAICSPMPGATIKRADGNMTIRGYAWSGGGRAVSRVDVSIDGGKNWVQAELESAPDQKRNRTWAWTLWEVTVETVGCQGDVLDVCCRAVDSSCNAQPETVESIWNFRGLGNNSWHHIKVKLE